MTYENIEVRTEAGKVGIVTLARPKALNALNDALMTEVQFCRCLQRRLHHAQLGNHPLDPQAGDCCRQRLRTRRRL